MWLGLRKSQTVEMDETLDRDYESFDFDDLVEAKNCLLRVLSVAEEQNKTIELLAVAEQSTEGLDFFNCIGAFSMLQANASSNERLSSRVDKHLNELRERIMSHREVTLNKRLALLTILSAIFMPLTLLSGIWGMNFKSMPELQPEGAYQKALIAMFSLAVIMVFCFRRSGFIDI
jgi:magnesium transporter